MHDPAATTRPLADISTRHAAAVPIRLAVIDVDGTLITSEHRVTAATRAALRAARARGLQILLATSRGPSARIRCHRRRSRRTHARQRLLRSGIGPNGSASIRD